MGAFTTPPQPHDSRRRVRDWELDPWQEQVPRCMQEAIPSWDASGTDTTAQRSSPFPTDPIDACFGFSAGRLRGRAQTPCTGGALPGSQLPARSNQGTPHLPMDEIYDATPPCRGGTRDEATTTKALPWPAPSQVADMPSSVTLTEPFLIQNESKPPANPTGQGPSRTRHDRAAKSTAGRDSSQALGQASTRQRRAGTWLPSSEAVQDPFKASKSVGGTKRKQRPKSSLPYDESTGLFMPKPAKVCEQVKAHGGSLRWSNSAPAVSQQRAAPTDGDMARKRKKITMDESPSGPCHAVKASPSAGNPSTRSAQASRRGKQARQQGKQSPSHTPPDPEPKRDVYLDAILVSTDSSYSSSPKTVPAEGIRKNGDRRGSTEERAAESMTRNDMTFLQRLCSTVKLAKMFAGIFGSGDSLAAMEDISMKMKTVRWGDVAPSADASPATSTGGTNEGKHAGRDNSTDDKASSPLNLVVRDSSPKPCRSAGEAAKPARRVARREQRQPSADGSYMLVEESNASLKILSPGWHVQALNISLCRPTRASQAEGTAKEKTVED
ncbi:hypothetical protein RJ55_06390 [Drechmeria coniospora]|nr:hypothetical protein RJ55_06390 [Drechmeria coniospora]